MLIYDRPTKSLLADWAKDHLKSNQTFSKSDVLPWFKQHYPKIRRNTVGMHVESMSINSPLRKHHPTIKPRSGHDLVFKLGPDKPKFQDQGSDAVSKDGDISR